MNTPEDKFIPALLRLAHTEASLGIRETSKNQGPGIQKYWTATSYLNGYGDRQPYCAAFACWLVKQASLEAGLESGQPLPRSAAVNEWPKWAAKQEDWDVLNPSETRVRAGDFVCFDFNGRDEPGGTHIGLAVGNESGDGTFPAVEANTNAAGSREGDGVYHKTRSRKGVFSIIRWVA